MKINRIFILAIATTMLLAGSTTNASAQQRTKGKDHKVKPGHSQKLNDPALKAAEKDIQVARKLLGHGLPIYEGHRALAIDLLQLASKDIRAGYRLGQIGNREMNSAQSLPKVDAKSEKALRKYSADEIEKSNNLLRKALPFIQDAIKQLNSAAGDYGGYRTHAMQALNESLNQVNIALKVRSGGGQP